MRKFTIVTAIKFFVFSIFVLILIGCSVKKEGELVGAWKFVSGQYTFPDTSMSLDANANLKSIKIFSKTHYSNMTQDTTQKLFVAHGGKYYLEGNQYTETLEISKNLDDIGNSATFKYQIVGNQLKLLSDAINEVWEKIE